jgi:transglutaminase-like putative cysteine protease
MKFEIVHRTRYVYAAPVRESFNEVRLQPVSNSQQSVDHFLLKVLPATRLRHHHDFYSNVVHHFEIFEPHGTLEVESQLTITTRPPEPLAADATPWPMSKISEAVQDTRCHEFLESSRYVEISAEIWRLAMDATVGCTDTWQAALAIARFVHGHITYQSQSTNVHTPAREVLARRQGVCQDFAHVTIGLCRALKIPALYVSGYLASETASATHAWMEVFVPGVGWRALDPTHNRQPDETYVKIAVGRDYADVAPVTGNYRGTTDRKMTVHVAIRNLGS